MHAEIGAACAVRGEAEFREVDEAGVFAVGCRDEDVVISGAPLERES